MTILSRLFPFFLLLSSPVFAEPIKSLRASSPAKQAILEMVKTPEEADGMIQLPFAGSSHFKPQNES